MVAETLNVILNTNITLTTSLAAGGFLGLFGAFVQMRRRLGAMEERAVLHGQLLHQMVDLENVVKRRIDRLDESAGSTTGVLRDMVDLQNKVARTLDKVVSTLEKRP